MYNVIYLGVLTIQVYKYRVYYNIHYMYIYNNYRLIITLLSILIVCKKNELNVLIDYSWASLTSIIILLSRQTALYWSKKISTES